MHDRIFQVIDGGRVTGEYNAEDYSLRSKKQTESYRKIMERRQNQDPKKFIVCYQKSIEELFWHMTLTERGMLFKLILHLEFGSVGKLVKEGKPLKQTELEQVIGKGKKATRLFIQKLESLSVLFPQIKGRTMEFFVNDKLHSLGQTVRDEYYTKLYVVKGKELVNILTNEELGVIWSILPYFHYESFLLCKNANEQNPDRYQFLSVGELAENIGVSEDALSPKLKVLQRKGVLIGLSSGYRKTFKVNPAVMFRKSEWTEHAQATAMEFEMLVGESGE